MTTPTILFGATSILGYSLARKFPDRVLPFITQGCRANHVRHWPMLKLDQPTWLAKVFASRPPDVLLYCHAVCDVPKCEAAPDWAREINVGHVRRLLAALPAHTRLIYTSSDHVFGGDGVYDEAAPTCPISVYGKTRVEAEELVFQRTGSLVVRVGLPIGPSPDGRTGHWDWLRYRMAKNLPVTIVDDEHRSVVWADDLADRIMRLSESSETGVRHITSTRVLSRIELADYLLSLFGMDVTYSRESRYDRTAPHLGRVELATIHRGDLSKPLPSVLDSPSPKMLGNSPHPLKLK